MTVKRSRSGSRVLAVLETIARHQPVGVSTLARELAADKSAVQRAIMTLADAGWIHPAAGSPTRWQLTARILAVAHMGHSGNDLRQRARGTLESLRDECGETVLLTVQDMLGFVVIEAIESRHMLRTVPHIGMAVPVRGSATARAMMPYMTEERQIQLLGKPPDAELLEEFARHPQARLLGERRRGQRRRNDHRSADSRSGWTSLGRRRRLGALGSHARLHPRQDRRDGVPKPRASCRTADGRLSNQDSRG